MLTWDQAAQILRAGGVVALPTDTIYGFSASLHLPDAIAKIYEAKARNPKKMLVTLAASLEELREHLPVLITDTHQEVLASALGPTTLIYHLAQGTTWEHPWFDGDSIAVRIPTGVPELTSLLEKTGPIVSTSINREGEVPLSEPTAILEQFGTWIEGLVDVGPLAGQASQIIEITPDGQKKILR